MRKTDSRPHPLWLILLLLILSSPAGAQRPPNIIFILADDLGYGEIGCYGQQRIHTPHIDSLATGGMRFTQYYATTLCASTRCSFVTGLSGAHAQIRDNYELGGYTDEEERGQLPLEAGTLTVASELRKRGYSTALMGKWGLGGPGSTGVPNRQGFDLFYGYLDQKQAHNYYPSHLWRNEKAEWLQPYFSPHQVLKGDSLDPASYLPYKGKIYSGDTITAEAIKFINGAGQQPFFLYLAYTLPHLALQVSDDALKEYAGQFPEAPYTGRRGYLPHPKPYSAYAAMISTLDRYVGQVKEVIRRQGLDSNTLIVFTSDNGATAPGTGGAPTDFFQSNGQLRGYKGSLYEGGIRVPLILRWPGKIREGTTQSMPCAVWDMLRTFCELSGSPAPAFSDGISLVPLLKGKKPKPHPYLYWEVHAQADGIQAVRWKNWKAMRMGAHKNPKAPLELYDLSTDGSEQHNVADRHPRVITRMKKLMAKRTPSPVQKWNF